MEYKSEINSRTLKKLTGYFPEVIILVQDLNDYNHTYFLGNQLGLHDLIRWLKIMFLCSPVSLSEEEEEEEKKEEKKGKGFNNLQEQGKLLPINFFNGPSQAPVMALTLGLGGFRGSLVSWGHPKIQNR